MNKDRGCNIKLNCDYCGKEFGRYPSNIKQSKNHFCSQKCKGQWQSFNKSGENSALWEGGIAQLPYCPVWKNKELKEYVFERDNFQCQNPMCSDDYDRLCRHHINYLKWDCNFSNILTLCILCNSIANYDREWHEAYYNEIMRRKMECVI